MLVGNSLGFGVHLLLTLSLATIEGDKCLDVALFNEAGFFDREVLLENGGVKDETIDIAVEVVLDLSSI